MSDDILREINFRRAEPSHAMFELPLVGFKVGLGDTSTICKSPTLFLCKYELK